ncbi:MAG TPA: class I SAM-dependent methyltransferase [Acetobacteraceae bacterium]|nr:class I SAM-dependent methyltransferase [Acetobacteraceae bacterium]
MNPSVRDCLAGGISPQVALAQLLFQGASSADIAAELALCPPHPRRDELQRLLAGRERQIDALAAEVAATADNHDASGATPEQGIARIAAFFDRAVAYSPEASVALYSLGDPAILAAATAEIVAWLEAHSVLAPGADVLDLGCGFGRVAAALAPRCRSVLGLDVSPGMVEEARRRHGAVPNLRFEQTGGQDLAGLNEQAFDLVLAIDSFPYIVQTGDAVARRHVADAARLLRPGGALCILNLSYRNDDALDQADAQRWADEAGLLLEVADPSPFALWDGSGYVLRR